MLCFIPILFSPLYSSPLTGPGSTVPAISVNIEKNLNHYDLSSAMNWFGHMNLDEVVSNDLDNEQISIMMKYRAEAFLSSLVYSMSKNDKKKYYYGKYRYAQLLYYDVDTTTGFNAGILKLIPAKSL